MACQRADAQDTAFRAQKIELGDAVQVDEMRGPCQAEVHHRHEALPAREDLGLLAMRGEEREQLIDGARRVVFEVGGLHFHLTSARSHICTSVELTMATISTETITA